MPSNNHSFLLKLEHDLKKAESINFELFNPSSPIPEASPPFPIKLIGYGDSKYVEIKKAPNMIQLKVEADGGNADPRKILFDKPINCYPIFECSNNYWIVTIYYIGPIEFLADPPPGQTPVTVTDKQKFWVRCLYNLLQCWRKLQWWRKYNDFNYRN